jgi:hypothetical protein
VGADSHTKAEDGGEDECCMVLAESSPQASYVDELTSEQQHEAEGELGALSDRWVVRRGRRSLPNVKKWRRHVYRW